MQAGVHLDGTPSDLLEHHVTLSGRADQRAGERESAQHQTFGGGKTGERERPRHAHRRVLSEESEALGDRGGGIGGSPCPQPQRVARARGSDGGRQVGEVRPRTVQRVHDPGALRRSLCGEKQRGQRERHRKRRRQAHDDLQGGTASVARGAPSRVASRQPRAGATCSGRACNRSHPPGAADSAAAARGRGTPEAPGSTAASAGAREMRGSRLRPPLVRVARER